MSWSWYLANGKQQLQQIHHPPKKERVKDSLGNHFGCGRGTLLVWPTCRADVFANGIMTSSPSDMQFFVVGLLLLSLYLCNKKAGIGLTVLLTLSGSVEMHTSTPVDP